MKISKGTLTRTIILGLALTNQLLNAFGYDVINISDDTINTLISTIFTIIAAVVAWWKNNSFTKSAIAADEYKTMIKEEAIK